MPGANQPAEVEMTTVVTFHSGLRRRLACAAALAAAALLVDRRGGVRGTSR